nr:MAG TPA: hypothetical protein [Crassvirales sp.]
MISIRPTSLNSQRMAHILLVSYLLQDQILFQGLE